MGSLGKCLIWFIERTQRLHIYIKCKGIYSPLSFYMPLVNTRPCRIRDLMLTAFSSLFWIRLWSRRPEQRGPRGSRRPTEDGTYGGRAGWVAFAGFWAATAAGDCASNGEWRSPPLQPQGEWEGLRRGRQNIRSRLGATVEKGGRIGLPQRLLRPECDVA